MHPALRFLNPFKRRSRHGGSQRRRHQPQRRTPYVVLSIGAVLFASAIGFMMWPGASDGYIDSKRHAGRLTPGQASDVTAQAVASDQVAAGPAAQGKHDPMQVTLTAVGQSGSERPSQLPEVKAAIRECASRRASLEQQSRTVDRFDPSAVSALNIEIALYNSQCAVRSGSRAAAEPPTNTVVAPTKTDGLNNDVTTTPTTIASTANLPRPDTAEPTVSHQATEANLRGDKPASHQPRIARLAGGQPGPNGTATIPKHRISHKPMDEAPANQEAKKTPVRWNATVLTVQSLLTQRGYAPGPIDGFMGKRTRAAVEAFQRDQKLPVNGLVTGQLLETILALDTSSPKPGAAIKAAVDANAAVRQAAKRETEKLVKSASAPANRVQPKDEPAVKPTTRPAKPSAAKPGPVTGRSRSLSDLTRFERQTVEWACANQRNVSAEPNAYADCIGGQLKSLSDVVTPNLDLLSAFDRKAIERLCAGPRYQHGLAAFYQCVNKQQKGLANVHRKRNIRDMSADMREIVKSKCDGLQFTQSLPVYYRCVDMQVSQARR